MADKTYIVENANNPIESDFYKDIIQKDSNGNPLVDDQNRIRVKRYVVHGSVGLNEASVDAKINTAKSELNSTITDLHHVTTDTTQTISGNKTFTGETRVPTVASSDSSTKAASTAFVKTALNSITGISSDGLVNKDKEQTITGLKTFNNDILFGSNGLRIRRNDTDKYIIIEAGADSSTASSVTISGTTRSNSEGVISLIARDNNNNYSSVYLKPDGTLAHNGNKVITQPDLANYVALSSNQTISGVKTFTNAIVGSITGNAATATKATQDSDGNTIKTTYAKLNSPALTGTPTAPTAAASINNTQIATTAYVKSQGYLTSHQSLSGYAKLASPAFTGTPTAPTASANTNDTQIATTAFVKSQGYLTSHQSLSNYLTKTTNVSEMGRYIDMHYDNATSKYDYDVRLQASSQGTANGKGNLSIEANAVYVPAPASDANDTRVATTAWVKARGYVTTSSVVPTGAVLPFAGGTVPSGYLLCNGAAISRTTYAALFAVIGTKHGAGNNSTTFNLPDLRDRYIIGANAKALGTKVAEQLPNVTHSHTTTIPCNTTNAGTPGAQAVTAQRSDTNVTYTSSKYALSTGNSIYVDSGKVYPLSLALNYIIKT